MNNIVVDSYAIFFAHMHVIHVWYRYKWYKRKSIKKIISDLLVEVSYNACKGSNPITYAMIIKKIVRLKVCKGKIRRPKTWHGL